MQWTVLTGDIVGSSEISPEDLDRIMATLDKVAWELSGWAHTSDNGTETAFARRSGDGWQIAINRPKFALRASLYVQARVHALNESFSTRIAVATGKGELPQNANADLNSAHGPVFRDSGRSLEQLSGHTLMSHAEGGATDAVFLLADHISQGWTQAQARAVSVMLPPRSGPRRIAAEQLGISRQAVDQALWAAGYPAIKAALARLEEAENDAGQ